MKTILCGLLMIIHVSVFAQDYSTLKDVVLNEKADYPKAEEKVLECSRFVLSLPIDDKNPNRLYALQFVLRWMQGTPDYNFEIDESIGKVVESDKELFSICLMSMSKFVLENKEKSKDIKEIKYNTFLILLNYVTEPKNKVTLNKELDKLIEVQKQDKLKEYLKL